jgi:hypothetical protein
VFCVFRGLKKYLKSLGLPSLALLIAKAVKMFCSVQMVIYNFSKLKAGFKPENYFVCA